MFIFKPPVSRLSRAKFKRALVDMYTELTILCPECGAMNTVKVDPSTQVQTAFCKECKAELHLVLARSRPASFAPPQQLRASE